MTRPLKLQLLQPLAAQFYAEGWTQTMQAVADQLLALLTDPADLTDGQFAALTSYAESVTVADFATSRLFRLVGAGNYAMATLEFTGSPRRSQEKAIWLAT